MKRFAQQYVIQEEDAENIVQDIFIDIWEKQLDFSSITNLRSYLFVILKNRCIDFLRRKNLEQNATKTMQKEYLLELKLKFESLEILENEQITDGNLEVLIHEAIDTLPERCKKIFSMNKLEGKKQKIIARELNISVHTVESQMAIAYKKLKAQLKAIL